MNFPSVRAYTVTYGMCKVKHINLHEGNVDLYVPFTPSLRTKNAVLMFGTGWLDLYGNEIFEKDIVVISRHGYTFLPKNITGYIEKHPIFGYVIKTTDDFRKKYLFKYLQYSPKFRLEIKGNTLQHEHLLKG